jgi:hypothetical protein
MEGRTKAQHEMEGREPLIGVTASLCTAFFFVFFFFFFFFLLPHKHTHEFCLKLCFYFFPIYAYQCKTAAPPYPNPWYVNEKHLSLFSSSASSFSFFRLPSYIAASIRYDALSNHPPYSHLFHIVHIHSTHTLHYSPFICDHTPF